MRKLMMRTLLWFLCTSLLVNAATVSVCPTGCTTSNLQTAFDSLANCGDTIQIKSTATQTGNFTITYRNCDTNPIIVTSDREAWLPPAGGRVSPSQLGNMAIIQAASTTFSALAGILDGSNRPPAGWNFIGIAFTTTGLTYQLVSFNVQSTATAGCSNPLGCAANSTQIADNITFDRCYFFMPSTPVVANLPAIQDVIRGDVTNLTVKNSFIGDGNYGQAVESHGIRLLTTAGPATLTNNFITAASEPIFVGGAIPSYPTYVANGITSKYNYTWRPWKWNGDPTQPFAADYVTASQNDLRTGPYTISGITNGGVVTITPGTGVFFIGSLFTITGVGGCTIANAANWRFTVTGGNTIQLTGFPGCNSAYISGGTGNEYSFYSCNKNHGELKWGTGITWQYNVGENSWAANQCMGQYNGFTDTLRPNWDEVGSVFSFTDSTHITWTGTYQIGGTGSQMPNDTLDLGICISLPTTGTECHPVSSFSSGALVSAVSFSAAPVGTFLGWVSYTGGAKLETVNIAHNVFKNVDRGYTILALGFSNGSALSGFGAGHTFAQNLVFADNSYITGYSNIFPEAGEADYADNPTGYTMDHNTFYYPHGVANGSFVFMNSTGCSSCSNPTKQPTFDASAITNNLFGISAAFPFFGDSTSNITTTTNQYFSNSNIKNNALPGAVLSGGATGGNTIAGNNLSAWVDPFNGGAALRNFTVVPSSAYYNAGTDGASLGADFTQLPLINNITITGPTLSFDVSAPINDVKNTQPCVLEISASRNLISDLGAYAVITNLDPTLTMGADLSTRSDVIVTGNHVVWPLNGLTFGSTYYGRLMCYGDTEWFTFVAISSTGTRVVPAKSAVSGSSVH